MLKVVEYCLRTTLFHPDGLCLYSGGQDMLKVFGWEPLRCFDALNVGWGKVSAMAIAEKQLVSCRQIPLLYFVLTLLTLC